MPSATVDKFRAARRVGTPIVAIKSPDPLATIASIEASFPAEKQPAILLWDCSRGIRANNDQGVEVLSAFATEAHVEDPAELVGADAAFSAAWSIPGASDDNPAGTILFAINGHLFLQEPRVIQAIANLRDAWKPDGRTFVLVGHDVQLPPELASDVLVLDEPLPDRAELEAIVRKQYADAKQSYPSLPNPTPETLTAATDALLGIAAFPAEQSVAMSLNKSGLKTTDLWERKRQMVEQNQGLSVWRGGETFKDVSGLANAKRLLTGILRGNDPPLVIVRMEEVEKAMAGAQGNGDNTGVSQRQHGELLTWQEDDRVTGLLMVGVAGCGKSLISKAAGGELGIPTVTLNLAAMQNSLVGASEANLRNAIKVVRAVGQGRVLLLASCNDHTALSPEFRSRFNLGIMVFDLPDAEERDGIWRINEATYKVKGPRPNDTGWTGREIRQCAEMAWRMNCSLRDASDFVVPVSVSSADKIDNLRTMANGRFISASYPGVYKKAHKIQADSKNVGRGIELD